MMKNLRYIVYPKDLIHFTGRGERYCRSLVQQIKAKEGLEKHTMLTYVEVARYLRLPEVSILRAINNIEEDLTSKTEKDEK